MNPDTAIIAVGILLGFLLGLLFASGIVQTPNATRRVVLRALQAFVNDPANGDETVRSIARRQIRRLQSSLRVDDDES